MPLSLFPGRHVVLDEADRMLEVGFADTVEQILSSSFPPGRGVSNRPAHVFTSQSTEQS